MSNITYYEIGDKVTWKRTQYEIKDVIFIVTTKRTYYLIKKFMEVSGYRLIETKRLDLEAIMYSKSWKVLLKEEECQCGAHSVYGKNCGSECHSDYCDLCKSTYGLGFDF